MTTAKKTAAKKPADHKPKQEKAPDVLEVEMRGQTWLIESGVADDFELLDDLAEIDQKRNPSRLPSMLRRLVGPDQYRKVIELLRDDESGRVSIDDGAQFVMDLFEELNPN